MRLILMLFVAFFALFCGSAQAAAVENHALGFTVDLPGCWAQSVEGQLVFEGQDFQAAYWCSGELGTKMPYVLVRSVETGMVKASDMVGLNKIAVQSTMNGMRAESRPEVVFRSFRPEKALFAYSIESGNPGSRILTNKYVYYTRRGMLEFTMVCGAHDSDVMTSVNLALRTVQLKPQMRYESRADATMSLASVIVPDGGGVVLLPVGFVLAMGVLGVGLFRNR
ncbi:hypothetical protein [Pseudodesulfovibrio senegalensis]|jgi:hypothetical protein|uniref:Uncharacterized protein n=1 Tax=Pseudodesulfovibrio senegalensis TaxID=1721087 RepID=A0A6N6N381_9BACT|nr:hypothetical protein [Pseudodesulfovibrio senegalensis]KAB1441892.1 hypothetical protein F8A88_09930 [Pseudodesulfovibrio senegalensis]